MSYPARAEGLGKYDNNDNNLTMHKALHPKNDVDGVYMSRKEGGRALASIQA